MMTNPILGEWFSANAWWLIPLFAWSLAWKGAAMWKAARNNHQIWFIVLLVINTVGILEMLYIFIWSKRNRQPE